MARHTLRRSFSAHSCSGFTLVELMVVMGVIVILAGMMVLGFMYIRNEARISRIAIEMNQLRTEAYALANEQDGSFEGIDCDAGNMKDLCESMNAMSPVDGEVKIESGSPNEWCAFIPIRSNSSLCIDRDGTAGEGGNPSCIISDDFIHRCNPS